METIHITNTSDSITPNFKMKEFWDTSYSRTKLDFDMPKALADGAQILRDYFKMPMTITSVYRPGALQGYHVNGHALDINPVDYTKKKDILASFKAECIKYINDEGSPLILKLRSVGITGLGIEMACIHIDCREDHFSRRDTIGKYMIFEYQQDFKGNITVNKAL